MLCLQAGRAGCLCLGAVARQGSSPALHLARKRRDERLVWATGRRRVGSGDPRSARPQFASGFDTEGQPSKGDRFRRDAVARMGDPAQPLLAPGVVDRVGARGASSVSRERLDLITRTIAFMFRRCRACLRFGDDPLAAIGARWLRRPDRFRPPYATGRSGGGKRGDQRSYSRAARNLGRGEVPAWTRSAGTNRSSDTIRTSSSTRSRLLARTTHRTASAPARHQRRRWRQSHAAISRVLARWEA